MRVSLTMKSGNTKLGPIPVTTTEEDSCPKECSLKDTDCYARFGPLSIHWRAVSAGLRGDNWHAFTKRVEKFAAEQVWRHNQAGDLPKNKRGLIHVPKLRMLAKAAAHTKGWTYTHYNPLDPHNAKAISAANKVGGLTINLSADNKQQADEYYQLGIAPVVVILHKDSPLRGNTTPNGVPIVVCPAQLPESPVTCSTCKLCQKADRSSIVGFLAHGTVSKRLSEKVGM